MVVERAGPLVVVAAAKSGAALAQATPLPSSRCSLGARSVPCCICSRSCCRRRASTSHARASFSRSTRRRTSCLRYARPRARMRFVCRSAHAQGCLVPTCCLSGCRSAAQPRPDRFSSRARSSWTLPRPARAREGRHRVNRLSHVSSDHSKPSGRRRMSRNECTSG